MIVKHRRGTTKEWRENNIIPEAGELVIEECDDGTRRAKFGTGYQYFSDLPYIDDKLWEEIDNAKVDLDTKITNLNKRLSRELAEANDSVKHQLETEVSIRNAAIKKLTDDVIEADTRLLKLMQESDEQLQKEIETLSGELQTSTESLEAKTNISITGLKSQVANIDSVVTGKFINHTTLFDKKLDNAVDDIVEDYNTKITGLTEELQATSAELAEVVAQTDENKAVIADFARDALNKIDSVKESLKTQIAAQANRIDNLIVPSDGESITDTNIINELDDLKVDHKGNRHRSAGTAVRTSIEAVEEEVQELREGLASYIDTDAINGLYYDIEGNTGLGQPYMLYLKTSNGEVLQDTGVQIVGGAGGGPGGGSSSSSTLKISYITKDAITVTSPEDAKLSFLFSGVDSSGDTLSQANAQWKVNGTTVARGIVNAGENTFDASNYVRENDTVKVLLIVTDDNGSVVTKTWSIQYVVLRIASDFNDKIQWTVGEEIPFSYKVEGALKKTAVFKLNGEEIGRQTLEAAISGFDRGNISYPIPAYDKNGNRREHGAYLLEVFLEATINGDTVAAKSHVVKDLIWNDATKVDAPPIIGAASQHITIKQYETAEIVYTVYDSATNTPNVVIEVDDNIVSSLTIEPSKDYGYTPTGVYTYSTAEIGAHIIKIICGKTEKVITVVVDSLGIDVAPVTDGLVFDFHPVGFSNDDTVKRLWSYENVHMSVSENFDWKNGGYQIEKDESGKSIPGTEHFCIKAGSTATIDYKLFEKDAKIYGKECKLVFKTRHVTNPEAVFLSCIDNTTEQNHIGIKMGAHQANIYGQSGNLELAYSEEDIIEFEFNISANTEAVPMVMGYEDGVPSRPMVYDDTYNFKQSTPKEITLGSPDCDLLIYRFKVYNTSLSADKILKNFIADARTSDEIISRYTRNLIYSNNGELAINGKLDPDVLAQACPWLRIYKLSAPRFTTSKGDKVGNTTIQQIYKDGDPILDNWICYNATHSGQGTSSNNYGAAGRNLDFIMNKDGAYFELGDGSTASNITLTRESVPVAYLNAKVNIASSNNLTNAILAARYNNFNPYRRPFVERDGVNTDFIKDTMEFHNCVIFIQETDPNLANHKEFADNDWHFYAIGNIGDSKKTDNTRATDPDDKYECCVEIMDVGLALSDFPRDTMMNAMGYDTKTGEYTWAKDENLGILYEKQEDGSYVLTSDTSVNLEKTYYVDILEHDDFSEDYTYGWRYLWEDGTDEENEEVFNHCKQKWIDFYRFVTTSTDDEFKANLKDYFIVDSALYYYLFTTRYCMVDNRAKNTFWHYGKAADGTYKFDLCWDYDNDTSLGLNNYGKQVYRYGLEDTDRDAANMEIFRESDSTFFCRIRDLFAEELQEMYKDLESKDAWLAESFIDECDAWQNEFPEELWRLDINRKYIRTYNSSFIKDTGDKQFLINMCNGRMKYHRRQWERNQEVYMASKYQTPKALGDKGHANFRVNRFESTEDMTVKPDYQFTLTPYSHVYLNVQYGGTKPISVRAQPNVATTVPFTGTLSADIINIGSAAAISDFGDLSAIYPNTASVQNASRVKTLKLGTDTAGYSNANFTTLTTGENALLEELDITNITFTGDARTLDLGKLLNLKKFYAFGTNLTSILFADGGKLAYVELPAVNNITLKNLIYLSSDNIKLNSDNYNSVVDLTVENCPLVDAVALFDKCPNINRVRLIGVNFGITTYDEFIAKWGSKKGITASGSDADNAALAGTVKFNELTGEQFSNLRTLYPDLTIIYEKLTSTITFKDTDCTTTIHEGTSENAADYANPVWYGDQENIPEGMIAKPTKAPSESGEFRYDFLGWSISQNIVVSIEDTLDPLTDEKRRAFREDAVKHVEGDRTLYPVFEAIRRCYTVTFKTGDTKLFELELPYGDITDLNAIDGYAEPTKNGYDFTGWLWVYPEAGDREDKDVNGSGIICYAQFTPCDQNRFDAGGDTGEDDLDTDPGYTIGWFDISNSYTLSDTTMAITKCHNKYNSVIKVPDTMVDDTTGKVYTITSIGGFGKVNTGDPNPKLELIYLPETLTGLQAQAFTGCNKLNKVELPSKLVTIGDGAFIGCASLTELTSNSPNFIVESGYLRDTNNTLIQGIAVKEVDLTNTSIVALRSHCFAEMPIESIEFSDNITTIPSNAFTKCSKLAAVTLPSNLVTLGATSFWTCSSLTQIILPSKLERVESYVFDKCSLENIIIPATVTSIGDHAFGEISTLKEVTFEGTTPPATIHKDAFRDSGVSAYPIIFNCPWSEETHKDTYKEDWTFGASYYTFNFDYKEGSANV